MLINDILNESISLQGFQLTTNTKLLTKFLDTFKDEPFFSNLDEEIEKIFPEQEGYQYDKARNHLSKYVNETAGEVIFVKNFSLYRNIDTGVGKHYGHHRFILNLSLKVLIRNSVIRQIDLTAKQSEKTSEATLHNNPAKIVFSDSKNTSKTTFILSMLKLAKKEFIKNQTELHKKLEAARNKALNAIHNVKPEKEFPEDKQIQAFNKFGSDLKKLVEKYSKFNVDDTAITTGYYNTSRVRAEMSGKIEFSDESTTYDYNYASLRSGKFVVKIGSYYPVEKAEAFAADYIKLVKKQLPVEIPVQHNDELKHVKLKVVTSIGTNYTTLKIYL